MSWDLHKGTSRVSIPGTTETFTLTDAVVAPDGSPRFGLFRLPPERINTPDYKDPSALFNIAKALREKRWMWLGIFTPDVRLSVAVAHLGYVGVCFSYVIDRKSQVFNEAATKVPGAMGVEVSRDTWRGTVAFDGKLGRRQSVRIESRMPEAGRHLSLNAEGSHGPFTADVTLHDNLDTSPPLCVMMPQPNQRFRYTQKVTTIACSGAITVGGESYTLDPATAFACIDYTAGSPARETVWRWACGTGRLDDGTVFGLNLCEPTYHDRFNENAVWYGGKLLKVSQSYFEFDAADPRLPWRIYTAGGEVNVTFKPDGAFQETFNAGIASENFTQAYGVFEGEVRDEAGKMHKVTAIPGVCENQRVV